MVDRIIEDARQLREQVLSTVSRLELFANELANTIERMREASDDREQRTEPERTDDSGTVAD